MSIDQLKNIIVPIVAKYPVTYAGIFGSYAKNRETNQSDLDILIRYEKPFSYFDLLNLEQELQNASGLPVDVVTELSLSPFIKEEVLKSAQTVYGQR